jgi:ribose transport system substrate-binding protein
MRLLLWSGKLLCLGLLGLLVVGCRGDSGKRIIILTNGNSPFWDACRVGLQEAEKDLDLKKAGLRAVLEVNDGTPQGQLDKLNQFAGQSNIVAIGVSALDANNAAIADKLRELRKKGVHIITIDSDVDREKFRDARHAFVGTNNLEGGKELGRCALNLLPDGGEYVTFVGRTGAQNAIERINGFDLGANSKGQKFKSLDSMGDDIILDKARENVRAALNKHKNLNVLVGIWSYNAPAIVDVVKERDRRKDITVVTFDAEPQAIKYMGEGMIDAMVVQNPYKMGYEGVRLMKALVEKNEATLKEMLPNYGKADGDIFDTGLRVVVPEDSKLNAKMFNPTTQFQKLGEFRQWLEKYKLSGS